MQEISRLESELVNLESQIQKLQESVEVKEANIKKFKCKIDQVLTIISTCLFTTCLEVNFQLLCRDLRQ